MTNNERAPEPTPPEAAHQGKPSNVRYEGAKPYIGAHQTTPTHTCTISGLHFHGEDVSVFYRAVENSHWRVGDECRIVCSKDGETVLCTEHFFKSDAPRPKLENPRSEPVRQSDSHNDFDPHPYVNERCPTCIALLDVGEKHGRLFWQDWNEPYYECTEQDHRFDQETARVLFESNNTEDGECETDEKEDIRTWAMQQMVEFLCRYYHATEEDLFEIMVIDWFEKLMKELKK